jgi:hypothetical protein
VASSKNVGRATRAWAAMGSLSPVSRFFQLASLISSPPTMPWLPGYEPVGRLTKATRVCEG